MKEDVIEKILTILVIIVFIIIVFMLLLKVLGKSPSITDLLIAVVVGLVLYTIRIEYSRGRFEGKIELFSEHTRDSFKKVKEDMNYLKQYFEENMQEIKSMISNK